MSSSNRLIVSILVIAALAVGFWMFALGPKREEANELSSQAGELQVALSEAQSKAVEAASAKREFPADYRQLVELGQAVPAGDETSSLLVELATVARESKVKFDSIQLEASSEATAPEATPVAPSAGSVPGASTVPPTEATASLLPLGATIGSAGLGVMPYSLEFSGNFFQIADFIEGIDSLVHTGTKPGVGVNGRLVTLDGFALGPEAEEGGSTGSLKASFAVTTYVTPPTQGLTAGATPSAPAPVTSAAGASAAATESTSSTSNPSEAVAAQ